MTNLEDCIRNRLGWLLRFAVGKTCVDPRVFRQIGIRLGGGRISVRLYRRIAYRADEGQP